MNGRAASGTRHHSVLKRNHRMGMKVEGAVGRASGRRVNRLMVLEILKPGEEKSEWYVLWQGESVAIDENDVIAIEEAKLKNVSLLHAEL